MALDWLWLAFILVGHLGVMVVFVNVVHALGMSDERMSYVKIGALAVLVLGSLGFVYATTQHVWTSWHVLPRVYAVVCLCVALIGIPATSLLRFSRRLPLDISERVEEVNFAEQHGKDNLIGEGKHAWILRIPGNESLRVCKREWEILLPSLPREWDGLSILQLTDLHFAPCYDRRFFELICEEAKKWESDLLLFTGDLIDDDAVIDWIVPLMSTVEGKLGTYSILGNHDYDQDHRRVSVELEKAGFTDLEGRWTELEIAGKTLGIGGTSYPWGPRLDLSEAPNADFKLLLSHSPDFFYRAVKGGIDLMLSGHNHGGQIRLPFVGPVFMPSMYSRHFDRGFFRTGSTLLHVGQGIAAKHPIRIGCVPEIGRFVLRAVGPNPTQADAMPRVRLQESTDSVLTS